MLSYKTYLSIQIQPSIYFIYARAFNIRKPLCGLWACYGLAKDYERLSYYFYWCQEFSVKLMNFWRCMNKTNKIVTSWCYTLSERFVPFSVSCFAVYWELLYESAQVAQLPSKNANFWHSIRFPGENMNMMVWMAWFLSDSYNFALRTVVSTLIL